MTPVVTILILIDGFLQSEKMNKKGYSFQSHNPYFNRWFSAIIIYKQETSIKEESQSLF